MWHGRHAATSLYHPEKTMEFLSPEAVVTCVSGWLKEGIPAVHPPPVSREAEPERLTTCEAYKDFS